MLSIAWYKDNAPTEKAVATLPTRLKMSLRRHGVIVSVCLGLIATLGVQAVLLLEIRQDRWTSAIQAAQNVLHTLDSDVDRNLNLLDLSLQGAQEATTRVEIANLDPVIRNLVLFDRAGSAEYLGAMLVLSPSGEIVYDASEVKPRSGNFADRDYFQVQKDSAQEPYISAPFVGRLGDDNPGIALSRRISNPDGSFDGVVMGAISLNYFRDLFSRINMGRAGEIALVRSDGRLVMRWPSGDTHDLLNASISRSGLFRHIAEGPSGSFTTSDGTDGVERHYLYAPVGRFPLTLVVGFSVDEVLGLWRRQALTFGLIGCVIAGAIVLLVLALQGALRREEKMSARFENLATTDWLTGLPNRRSFDERLIAAARSTARSAAPLALLMIDVDRFKVLNDRFGHGRGDEVLRQISQVLKACARRPDDMVARYGGEEFAAVLPGTDAAGAARVAEAMRAAVEHAFPSPDMTVTVSIGAASGTLAPETETRTLLAAADAALYEAKAQGRNRVVLASGTAPVTEALPLLPPSRVRSR